MLGIGHRFSIAGTATIVVLTSLGGCVGRVIGPPPPPIAYQRPAHPARTASRPRVPQQTPNQNAIDPASAPALSEQDKASLFERFDAWENNRATAGAPTPAASPELNP